MNTRVQEVKCKKSVFVWWKALFYSYLITIAKSVELKKLKVYPLNVKFFCIVKVTSTGSISTLVINPYFLQYSSPFTHACSIRPIIFWTQICEHLLQFALQLRCLPIYCHNRCRYFVLLNLSRSFIFPSIFIVRSMFLLQSILAH
ncbi:hypothetical protein BLOT_003022 [Blomia tropicalis]|nr:hypothetical protein BLOT_003022 [Blomia tropicalis]